MDASLFFPAPAGLPVPVDPPRGSEEVLRRVSRTNWKQGLQARSDRLIRAGALWLFGFLDEAHHLAQLDRTRDGSYWHALVHRSGGDFGNSLYWFGRVGRHPLFPELKVQVRQLLGQRGLEGGETLTEGSQWQPERLVALCERAAAGELADQAVLQQIAQVEYNLLMDHVLFNAIT